MKVVDKVIFRTINWTIESDNDTYHIQLQEDLTNDSWYLTSDEEGSINKSSDLGQLLIKLCLESEE